MSQLTAEERKSLIEQRRIKFEEEKRIEEQRLKTEAANALYAKWEGGKRGRIFRRSTRNNNISYQGIIGAKKHNELNVSWQEFTSIHPAVYELKNLIAIRLVGNTFHVLPDDLFTSLQHLEVLFLTANRLTALPESIGNCLKLRELNIMKNEITELPDSLCNLSNLTSFEASNNKLKYLPQNFGNLVRLNM